MSRFQFKHWLWLIPILLLSTAMISTHLTTDAYWADEGSTLRNVGAPPYTFSSVNDLLFHVGVSEWPPAYFVAVAGWGRIVGWTEFATRTLSLLMGVLSVAMMYRLGSNLFKPSVGVVSAFLLGTSIYFVFYAHELRGYILYILLTISCMTLYWHIIHQAKASYKAFTAFISACVILMYTHYLAIFVIVALGLYHLLFARQLQNWKRVFFSFMLIGIAYLPWFAVAILNVIGVSNWDSGLTTPTLISIIVSATSNTLWFITIPLIVCSLIFCRTRATTYIWFVGLILLSLSLTAHTISPFIFNARHLIGMTPILIGLIAVGITSFPYQRNLLTGSVLLIWLIAGLWLNRNLDYPQTLPGTTQASPIETTEIATELIDTCVQPNDTVFSYISHGNSGWDEHVAVYYLADSHKAYNLTMLNFMSPLDISHPVVDQSTPYETRFQQITTNSEHVWVFVAPFARPRPEVEQVSQLLAETYDYCGQITDNPFLNAYLYQNDSKVTCSAPAISTSSLSACDSDLLSGTLNTSIPTD